MIIIGKFLKNYGLKGHIKAKFFLENIDQVLSFKNFFIKDGVEINLKFLKKIKEIFICKINEYNNIDETKTFVGKLIYINEKELPKLEENFYYFHELEGLDVRLDDKVIGEVISVNNHGAGDYFEIRLKNSRKEILAPRNTSHIIEINIKKKFIKLNTEYYKNEI